MLLKILFIHADKTVLRADWSELSMNSSHPRVGVA